MAIFLGIDGGGSKTSCLIGDETSVLGTGRRGQQVVRVGEAQARESLAAAIRQACTVANLKPSEIGRRLCRPGGRSPARDQRTGEAHRLGNRSRRRVEVVGDKVIALQAAFGEARA